MTTSDRHPTGAPKRAFVWVWIGNHLDEATDTAQLAAGERDQFQRLILHPSVHHPL